jgi:hypothetical protein
MHDAICGCGSALYVPRSACSFHFFPAVVAVVLVVLSICSITVSPLTHSLVNFLVAVIPDCSGEIGLAQQLLLCILME